ncbi:alpha/beta fold hydrolase [Naasia lichenicola]|uniref:Alpha/beta hydrolase n=1 Tax=Naasia lichenicola TaxID=2565933 RepID=A0A4S4FJ99_9MICO|nr:alpha/beta hydrolase [Naasia lichenicola]THG29295.1 alpha/beta hydrolase [Naasia lichenicola]
MPFTTIGDVELFYTDEGTGALTLVLLHGWTCDSHDWIHQLPFLTESWRVLAFDSRGHGRSSAPASGYTPHDLADEVVDFVDQMQLERVVLVGHSLGGVVASIVASRDPDRIAGVVVIDPPYGFDEEGAQRNLGLVGALHAGPANEVVAGFFGVLEGPHTPPHLITWHRRRALGSPERVVAAVAEGTHGSMDSIVNLPHTLGLITARRVPTLAIHISSAKAEWEGGLMHDPLSRSVAFENAGHWVHQEEPAAVNAVIGDWIGRVASSGVDRQPSGSGQ